MAKTDVETPASVPTVGETAPRGGVARRHRLPRPSLADLLVTAGYLLIACYVFGHLLVDPRHRVQAHNVNDNGFFQWVIAHAARVLTHGDNPLFTTSLNASAGVNLIANTSILGLAIPLAPITLLFGASLSYLILLIFGLTATATSWYYVLSRHVVRTRGAAVIGGGFCGFAPGMIAHANGHPNIITQFLLPLIIWRAIRMRERGRVLRKGVILGLLVTWQMLINEELLFLTVLGFGIFAIVYALLRHTEIRGQIMPFVRGMLVASGVAGVLLAYPLYVQFFGPQAYQGIASVHGFGADLFSFPAFSSESLAGNQRDIGHLAQNAAEENSFFGWPLLVVLLVLLWRLRRNALAIATAAAGLAFVVFSWGPRLTIRAHHTSIPGPWAVLNDLPLFNTVVPTRMALLVIPPIGVVLALGIDEIVGTLRRLRGQLPARLPTAILSGVLVVALLPIAPTPLRAISKPPIPAFISDGAWRAYVPDGRSIVPVPLPRNGYVNAMYWAASTTIGFTLPRGYFLGPKSESNRTAIFGAPPRPTSTLLESVFDSGVPAIVNTAARDEARKDLTFWHAAVVVLPSGTTNEEALWKTVSQLLSAKPIFIDGVWLWDVRGLVGAG